ncbi:hypothetical protein ACFV6B_40165 [Streptomyces microflavus]|uniref:hypothetical protein n=1 Tax=Streptomyces microflavus TaxID=1919 RepID=UPI003665C1F2
MASLLAQEGVDPDVVVAGTDTLARLVAALHRDPRLAYVQPRISDPVTGVTLRRRVPRLRASAPTRPGSSSPSTSPPES